MKSASFGYARPVALEEASRILRETADAKIFAGGQSLGPMLNLRLVRPDVIVDVTAIPELVHVEETEDQVFIGACVTHANIEDRYVPDPSRQMMPTLAKGIAYRAVRNRGTVGGSLCHADPAADWVSILSALSAQAVIYGAGQRRRVPVERFVTGPFEAALASDEILEGVSIPKLSARARWGYYKFCRKTGEFADAIGAVVCDPDRDLCRVVIGATGSSPFVVENASHFFRDDTLTEVNSDAVLTFLDSLGLHDAFERQLHLVAVERAASRAAATA